MARPSLRLASDPARKFYRSVISGKWFLCRVVTNAVAMLVLAGCTTAPTEYRAPGPLAASERADLNRRVFTAAWDLVNEKYFDAKFKGVDWPAMRAKYAPAAAAAADDDALYRALGEMVEELSDKHMFMLSPRQVHAARAGHITDTGIRYRKVEGQWIVTEVIAATSAESAGVKKGWLLVSRDERPLSEDIQVEILSMRVGESIRYAFIDGFDQPRTLSVVPQLRSSDSRRFVASDLPGGVRYLRFDSFSRDAVKWISEEVKSHADAPGLVIDLRSNPGGKEVSLRNAVRVFFPKGKRLGETVGRAGKIKDMDTLSFRIPLYPGKIVVLTSPQTASSAEIFSHVLQFYKRAVIVGEQTPGVVEGGFLHAVPGGGFVNVAEVDYIGLDGRRLEGFGVTPDISVPTTLADLRAGRDAGLEAALAALRSDLAEN